MEAAPAPPTGWTGWKIGTVVFAALFAVATIAAGLEYTLYSNVKRDDNQQVVIASTNLLTQVLSKLASASGSKAAKTGVALFASMYSVFTSLSKLHSIVSQWQALCTNQSSVTLFGSATANISANYTSACAKYGLLWPLVDPFSNGGGVSIETFVSAVADVAAALMKLDNAIVNDP